MSVRHPTHGKNAHTGNAELVRSALSTQGKSITQLAAETGLHPTKVNDIVKRLCDTTGGCARIGARGKTRLYVSSDKPVTKITDDFRIAGKITLGRGSVWGAGLA